MAERRHEAMKIHGRVTRCAAPLPRGAALLLLAGLMAASSGCYRYRSLNGVEAVDAGSEVRARLTPEGRSELLGRTGRDSDSVEGELVQVAGESVRLVVGSRTAARSGRAFGTGIDTVTIPLRHVREVQAKELNTARTGLLVGGSGLALGAFIILGFESSGGSPPGPGGDGGADAFRPGLYLGWTW